MLYDLGLVLMVCLFPLYVLVMIVLGLIITLYMEATTLFAFKLPCWLSLLDLVRPWFGVYRRKCQKVFGVPLTFLCLVVKKGQLGLIILVHW